MKYLGLVILLFSLSSCSSWFAEEPDHPAPTQVVESQPQSDIAAPMIEPVQNETVDVTQNQTSYIDDKYSPEKKEKETDSLPPKYEVVYKSSSSGIAPEKSLGWLKNGNKRFLKGATRADGQSKKDIKRLIKTEKPHAVVFSSSDSRIPPEIIFDEKLGEIYVVRNLGLTIDPSVINSIDYAVGVLGARLIVVMDKTYPGKGIDFGHADQITQKLVDESQVLKSALEAKDIQIVPAVYNMESGKVSFGK